MAGTHAALISRGFEVTATDMSPDVVGQNLGGVTVCDGTENRKFIEVADLVIITGMTLPNGTLPSLIEAAKINNTSTMIWAVTGKNLGHYHVVHGIDCVISDPAPFLQLPGPARNRDLEKRSLKRKTVRVRAHKRPFLKLAMPRSEYKFDGRHELALDQLEGRP